VPFFAGGFLLLIALVFVSAGVQEVADARRNADALRSARGRITAKTLTPAVRGVNPRSRYAVRYEFHVPDGALFSASTEVDPEYWEGLAEGQPVQVSYLATDPRRSRVGGDLSLPSGVLFLLLGGILSTVGGTLAYWFLPRPLFDAAWGTELAGRLTSAGRTVWLAAKVLMTVFVSAVLAELLPPVRLIQQYTQEREAILLWVTGGAALCGLVLFLGSLLAAMSKSGTSQFSDEFTLGQLRQAWASGDLGSARWRLRLAASLGGLLLAAGIFSTVFVVGPPFVKVLLTLLAVYALIAALLASRDKRAF
jgi:hypothetical protein